MPRTNGKLTDLSKTHHVLQGLLKGIGADDVFTFEEAKNLNKWLNLHLNFADLSPFKELLEITSYAIELGFVEKETQEEVLHYCRNFTAENGLVDQISKDVRVLHGIIQGVASDGSISETEAWFLQKWSKVYAPASYTFPYRELLEILNRILIDNQIDPDEHCELMSFCQGFVENLSTEPNTYDPSIMIGTWMETDAPILETIDHICCKNPQIKIVDNCYCFTGQMKHGKRNEMHQRVENCGGIIAKSVILDLDFLVIGANSNPCWMYSTYGRKIEKVQTYNQTKGTKITIIHENNFIEALKSEELSLG